jgi:hypothetical protein
MKTNFILGFFVIVLSLLFIPQSINAQNNFIPGEIASVYGDTLQGRIDFRDWNRTPSEIRFTQSTPEDARTYSADDIQYFKVADQKYVSRKVTIDETPIKVSQVREILPSTREERVFLKVLVQGELSLYQYRQHRVNFYIEEEQEVIELISREYVVNVGGAFVLVDRDEEKYIQQLDELKTDCSQISKRRIDYNENKLSRFVVSCNVYNETGELVYLPDTETIKVSVIPYIGFGTNNVEYTAREGAGQDEFESMKASSTMIGLKLLFTLPGELDKRAVTVALDYINFKVKDEMVFDDFNSVNFRLGYRAFLEEHANSAYVEGGIFLGGRDSRYYKDFDDESFLVGINLELGYRYKSGYAGARIDLANKRTAEVKQSGISGYIGFGF